jgi:hypothetical protein
MGYFKKFGTIEYAGQKAANLLTAVLPSRLNIDKAFVYQNYTIMDGESPESIADKMYKDPQLYWVLLVVNNIVNPYTDWPIEESVMEEFVQKKYGDVFGVHHFTDNRIDRVCDDVADAEFRAMPAGDLPFYIVPKTNLDHEREINEGRREIIAVNPRYVSQFVEIYNRAIEGK